MAGHIATAARTDWCTPKVVLDPVRAFFSGRIDLDPCGNKDSLVDARSSCWGPGDLGGDGLERNWEGSVYCNPPFGAGLDRWIHKAAYDATNLCRCEVVMLIPASVDTRAWQEVILPTAAAVCFWRGRIRFVGAKAAAPMACALVYWGPRAQRFEATFEKHGRVIRP